MTADGDASMVYTATYSFDATTYAKAYGTGNDVTSLFAAADVNRYEGSSDNTVTYYSRSNWEGTVTPGAVKLAMTQQLFDDTATFPPLTATNGRCSASRRICSSSTCAASTRMIRNGKPSWIS